MNDSYRFFVDSLGCFMTCATFQSMKLMESQHARASTNLSSIKWHQLGEITREFMSRPLANLVLKQAEFISFSKLKENRTTRDVVSDVVCDELSVNTREKSSQHCLKSLDVANVCRYTRKLFQLDNDVLYLLGSRKDACQQQD